LLSFLVILAQAVICKDVRRSVGSRGVQWSNIFSRTIC